MYKGKRVGTFTEVAAFSNGFSKTLAAGGVAGIVYTKDRDLYWRVRSIADRGKPFHKPDFNFRMTTNFLFPSHNFNADEISCAIGTSVLSKLQNIIDRRHKIADKIDTALKATSTVRPANLELPNTNSSIFFHTVLVDINKLKVSKVQFAKAIAAEGITINTDYRDITCEWQWIPKYVREYQKTPNSIDFRDRTFNILFNENFGDKEIKDIIKSILKVEKFYKK
jgi:dTDP-4-amino-4,6-dideoxygalactose transaminase